MSLAYTLHMRWKTEACLDALERLPMLKSGLRPSVCIPGLGSQLIEAAVDHGFDSLVFGGRGWAPLFDVCSKWLGPCRHST